MAADESTRSSRGIVGGLNGLIETCKDGESGFGEAAEGVRDPDLQRLLESYSRQRAEYASELQTEVRRLGGEAAQRGHLAGALHRGWITLKQAVTGRDEGAILAECERGEDAALVSYREVLSQDLPADLRGILERQYLRVKEAHDHIRSLEKAHTGQL